MNSITARTAHLLVAAGTAVALSFGLSPSAAADAGPATTTASQVTMTQTKLPDVVRNWEKAWNQESPEQLSALFTKDARYTDHAFDATFRGQDGVATWVGITGSSIDNLRVKVHSADRFGKRILITWTFSGTLVGAPTGFSVPAVTVLNLRGDKIRANDDFYSIEDLLTQSGLPADTDLTP